MSVEDRIKAIEERWQVPAGTLFDLEIAMCDIEYLLSELKRHRKGLKRIESGDADGNEHEAFYGLMDIAKQTLYP